MLALATAGLGGNGRYSCGLAKQSSSDMQELAHSGILWFRDHHSRGGHTRVSWQPFALPSRPMASEVQPNSQDEAW